MNPMWTWELVWPSATGGNNDDAILFFLLSLYQQFHHFLFHLLLTAHRPKTPVEKALEFFHFDFEFADEPSDTSLIANADVFKVDPNFPDMFITDSRGYSEVMTSLKKRKNSENIASVILVAWIGDATYSIWYFCWTLVYIFIFSSSDNSGHSVKNTSGGRT